VNFQLSTEQRMANTWNFPCSMLVSSWGE